MGTSMEQVLKVSCYLQQYLSRAGMAAIYAGARLRHPFLLKYSIMMFCIPYFVLHRSRVGWSRVARPSTMSSFDSDK